MDHHQSDLAGSTAPIARTVGRRRVESSLAAIERWIAESVRRSCDEEPVQPVTSLLLDDDRGSPRRDDEAVVHDCATVIVG